MITKLTKHDNCDVVLIKNKPTHAHYARLVCLDCTCHVQWVGERNYYSLKEMLND